MYYPNFLCQTKQCNYSKKYIHILTNKILTLCNVESMKERSRVVNEEFGFHIVKRRKLNTLLFCVGLITYIYICLNGQIRMPSVCIQVYVLLYYLKGYIQT